MNPGAKKPLTDAQKEAQVKALKFLKKFGLGLIILGAPFVLFGIYFIFAANETLSWNEVEGKVVATRVETSYSQGVRTSYNHSPTTGTKRYYVSVEYSFEANELPYTSRTYSLGEADRASKFFNKPEKARAKAKQNYPLGSPITVFYDPDSPTSSVLSAGINWGSVAPLLIGIFFVVCGLGFKFGLRFPEQSQ